MGTPFTETDIESVEKTEKIENKKCEDCGLYKTDVKDRTPSDESKASATLCDECLSKRLTA